MKEKLEFRPADPTDYAHGTELIMLTLRDFGDHFFGFGSHEKAMQVLERLFVLPRNRFSYQHAVLACAAGQVVGLLALFDARSMRRSWLATGLQLFRVYSLAEIFSFVQLLLNYQNEEIVYADEYYIAHLAVFPQYQRRGYGQQLMDYTGERASSLGLYKLSLLTELENQAAINLYHQAGFSIVETIMYPEKMHYLGSQGSLRMVKKLTV